MKHPSIIVIKHNSGMSVKLEKNTMDFIFFLYTDISSPLWLGSCD